MFSRTRPLFSNPFDDGSTPLMDVLSARLAAQHADPAPLRPSRRESAVSAAEVSPKETPPSERGVPASRSPAIADVTPVRSRRASIAIDSDGDLFAPKIASRRSSVVILATDADGAVAVDSPTQDVEEVGSGASESAAQPTDFAFEASLSRCHSNMSAARVAAATDDEVVVLDEGRSTHHDIGVGGDDADIRAAPAPLYAGAAVTRDIMHDLKGWNATSAIDDTATIHLDAASKENLARDLRMLSDSLNVLREMGQQHQPQFDPRQSLERRPSSARKGITVHVVKGYEEAPMPYQKPPRAAVPQPTPSPKRGAVGASGDSRPYSSFNNTPRFVRRSSSVADEAPSVTTSADFSGRRPW
jgi:hypothetical protein